MAIKRIYETGFEWGDLSLEISNTTAAIMNTISVTNTTARTGNYCLRINGRNNASYASQALGTYYTQCRLSFHFKHDPKNTRSTIMPTIMGLTDSAVVITPMFMLRWTGESLMAVSGYSAASYPDSDAHYGMSPSIDLGAANSWRHIGLDIKIHPTDGWCCVYYEGEKVIDYYGKTDHTSSHFNSVYFGMRDSDAWGNTDPTYIYYDDIYIDDTTGEVSPSETIPDRRFALVGVHANGSFSQWVGSDGNSEDNYMLVDEYPPDGDSSTVNADQDNVVDSYFIAPFEIPAGWNVAGFIPNAIAKSDSSNGQLGLQLGMYSDPDMDLGETTVLATDYRVARSHHPLAPDGGDWSEVDLNNIEVVIRTNGELD